jgi:hypothetical protein
MHLQLTAKSVPHPKNLSKPALPADLSRSLEGDLDLDGSMVGLAQTERRARGPSEAEVLALLGD